MLYTGPIREKSHCVRLAKPDYKNLLRNIGIKIKLALIIKPRTNQND